MWKGKIIDENGNYYISQFIDNSTEGEGIKVFTAIPPGNLSQFEGCWKIEIENSY